MPLHLTPGKTIKRTALHRRYGGRQRGGISPSGKSPNVFLFTDPKEGARHGYIYDGLRKDGLYDYTGEGQSGDQQMTQGNRAIRDHNREDRELHLFKANGSKVLYIGQYEYVEHYPGEAWQTDKRETRAVIVFRLLPVGITAPIEPSPVERLERRRVKMIPVERQWTEESLVRPGGPYTAKRREQKLVHSYEAKLEKEGHKIGRLQLWPPGEPAPFLTDLYDATTNTLIEAKSSVARTSFRMAIGQLADYARLVKPTTPRKAILLPERPRRDLIKLAKGEGISVIWAKPDGKFGSSSPASP
ncbi:MAG TPA: hypothetical protein VNS60_14110 [Solirubrobacterales bacterium]|nr:hypothetical protein [Solirubrobacterales bacterium]